MSVAIEQTLLGCMINRVEYRTLALARLAPSDFLHGSHGKVFETIKEMVHQNLGIDVVTLPQYLAEKGLINQVGGYTYIARLADAGSGYVNVEDYIRIIREASEKHRLKSALKNSLQMLDGDTPHETILSETQKSIMEAVSNRKERKYRLGDKIAADYFDILEQRKLNPVGISWGFRDLNQTLGLILPKRVYYIGARPGVGKTALALSITRKVLENGYPVYFNTQEMSEEQIMDRLVSAETMIPGHLLQHGLLQDQHWVKVAQANNVISSLPLAIDEERQTTSNLFIKVRQFQADMLKRAEHLRDKGKVKEAERIEKVNGIGLVVIDYFQLFKDPSKNTLDEWTQDVSGNLISFVKELNIPIVCLAQLNRNVEHRSDRLPQLSDLRGGGALEQDGWAVLFLNRPQEEDDSKKLIDIDVIIAKNRSGPIKNIKLQFLKEFTKFSER